MARKILILLFVEGLVISLVSGVLFFNLGYKQGAAHVYATACVTSEDTVDNPAPRPTVIKNVIITGTSATAIYMYGACTDEEPCWRCVDYPTCQTWGEIIHAL